MIVFSVIDIIHRNPGCINYQKCEKELFWGRQVLSSERITQGKPVLE